MGHIIVFGSRSTAGELEFCDCSALVFSVLILQSIFPFESLIVILVRVSPASLRALMLSFLLFRRALIR
jgi:hypothetical protein